MGKLTSMNSKQIDSNPTPLTCATSTPLDMLITKKNQKGKRELKQLEKEKQAMHLRITQNLKPSQIAK